MSKPYWFEPTKKLAKRVRAALVAKAVKIGHESSLQVTARLQGYANFFHVPKGSDALEITVFGAVAAPPFFGPDWRACVGALIHACERWLESHPSSRLLRLCGQARYAWEVVTLRPQEIVPGLTHSNLPTDESCHLLRRFQAAVRGGNLEQLCDTTRRRLNGLDEPPTHCRLDAHRVLRALKERGDTWESFCNLIGLESQVPAKPVEFGVFLGYYPILLEGQ